MQSYRFNVSLCQYVLFDTHYFSVLSIAICLTASVVIYESNNSPILHKNVPNKAKLPRNSPRFWIRFVTEPCIPLGFNEVELEYIIKSPS